MSQQQPLRRVDPKLWQSCAGNSSKIPKLHSKLYYFPLGHLEHANPFPNTESLSLIDGYRPLIPCIISVVDLLADPHTDEVFTKILLTPLTDDTTVEPLEVPRHEDNNIQVVYSVKTLTQSDANNGGAFSVPRACANNIFPSLKEKTPFQELSVTDIQGEVWKFRHIYSGTPLRHLITTGWSKFVDKKKLVVGDTFVFMKKSAEQIFVGIRRKSSALRSGKISEKQVMEAAELAEKNKAFEVVYYPAAGDNFVVDAKVVEDAMKMNWSCGMRVKLSLKKDHSSILLQHGTISNLSAPSNRPWHMLQVKWDEHKVLNNAERVSPWQVEYVPDIPPLQCPPTKKLRVDKKGEFSVPLIEFYHSSIESVNSTLSNCHTLPDDMQGARHNHFSNSTPKMFVGVCNCNTKKVGFRSIKLFGNIIQVAEIDLPDSEIKEDDGCKGCIEIEGNENLLK